MTAALLSYSNVSDMMTYCASASRLPILKHPAEVSRATAGAAKLGRYVRPGARAQESWMEMPRELPLGRLSLRVAQCPEPRFVNCLRRALLWWS